MREQEIGLHGQTGLVWTWQPWRSSAGAALTSVLLVVCPGCILASLAHWTARDVRLAWAVHQRPNDSHFLCCCPISFALPERHLQASLGLRWELEWTTHRRASDSCFFCCFCCCTLFGFPERLLQAALGLRRELEWAAWAVHRAARDVCRLASLLPSSARLRGTGPERATLELQGLSLRDSSPAYSDRMTAGEGYSDMEARYTAKGQLGEDLEVRGGQIVEVRAQGAEEAQSRERRERGERGGSREGREGREDVLVVHQQRALSVSRQSSSVTEDVDGVTVSDCFPSAAEILGGMPRVWRTRDEERRAEGVLQALVDQLRGAEAAWEAEKEAWGYEAEFYLACRATQVSEGSTLPCNDSRALVDDTLGAGRWVPHA